MRVRPATSHKVRSARNSRDRLVHAMKNSRFQNGATPHRAARRRLLASGAAMSLHALIGARSTRGDAATLGEARAFSATSAKSMIATVQPLATAAGIDAFAAGGNAVDAAVAAALTLGVVDGHNSGIGGGCLVLIRSPDGRCHALDGRETAPALAHRDMFVKDGRALAETSQTGPLAAAVPGALAAYDQLLRKFGRRSLAELLRPAADLAENGFALDVNYADKLRRASDVVSRFEETRRVLLKPDGSAYAAGETLRQPDLAKSYRAIADEGPGWFYRGEYARRADAWMRSCGGMLRANDFAAYAAKWREPLRVKYRGADVIGFPPPSSGGVHVAQMLQMLERFSSEELRDAALADRVHLVAEAMKLAFADRARWLGDADFARVPRGLIDREYAKELAARINRGQAARGTQAGTPPRAEDDVFEKHTTHVAAADAEGWWVALTATVNTTFGAKVIVPGTGILLNNEMDDFSIQPGVANAFGLVGAEANSIQPGKRPLSSMSPTLVERAGAPWFTVGAAGGPTIISQVLLTILRVVDEGRPIDAAIAAGRWHHQWRPDKLRLERRLASDELVAALRRRGHDVELTENLGVSQGIAWDARQGRFLGAHDPRVPGRAEGRG